MGGLFCHGSFKSTFYLRMCVFIVWHTGMSYFSYCFYQQLEEKGLESKNRGGSQSISWTKSFSLSVVGNGKNTKSKLIWFSLSPIFSHPNFHSPKFSNRVSISVNFIWDKMLFVTNTQIVTNISQKEDYINLFTIAAGCHIIGVFKVMTKSRRMVRRSWNFKFTCCKLVSDWQWQCEWRKLQIPCWFNLLENSQELCEDLTLSTAAADRICLLPCAGVFH